jgi:23S rRNA (cytidine2498-2'-O)-methyltransferase
MSWGVAPSGSFVFATCRPASLPWLKADLLSGHPEFRWAFSRPGLLTFKYSQDHPPHFEELSPLARCWGTSLGLASNPDTVMALLAPLRLSKPLRLHVFERDPEKPSKQAEICGNTGERANAVATILRAHAQEWFHVEPVAVEGDICVDVIVAPAAEPEEPWLIGHHLHHKNRSPFAGGPVRVAPPTEAPSRAYSKLEEAVAWSGVKLGAQHTAVEIGSAPGGCSLALLHRGLSVVGIDPNEISPYVLDFVGSAGNRFRHLKKPASQVVRTDLPKRVEWVLCDINRAPPVALTHVQHLVAMLRPTLHGIILTLKLNDDLMHRALPSFLERVEKLGFGKPRAIQLPSNHSEVTAVAAKTSGVR